MRLTRRGWVLFAGVLLAFLSGVAYGPRSLNVIAAPGAVALVASVLQLRAVGDPEVDRRVPARGTRGESVVAGVEVDAERSIPGRIHEEFDPGLRVTEDVFEVDLGEGGVEYDLHLEARGEAYVGPTTVEMVDVFGLFARSVRNPTKSGILVRPRVYSLSTPGGDDVVSLYGGLGDERREFEHLRDYRPGDPLRDVHWRSSAKRPDGDFVVKEFGDEEEVSGVIEVAVETTEAAADGAADAAASLAFAFLDAGFAVGVRTPIGRVEPDRGVEYRERVLDHLAFVESGELGSDVRSEADVAVRGTGNGVDVRIDDRRLPFDALRKRR